MAATKIDISSPEAAPAPPPPGLSLPARRLWTDAVSAFPFRPTELALLESALRALDRAEAARAQVEAEGLTVVTEATGAVRAHPSIRTEAESRREFRLTWRALGLVDSSGPSEE